IEADKIHGQFAADDDLFQEGLLRLGGGRRPFYGLCDRKRADVSEMKIWGKMAGALQFGMISVMGVVAQAVANKSVKHPKSLQGTASATCNRRNRAIKNPCRDEIFAQNQRTKVLGLCPWDPRLGILEWDQELWQQLPQAWPDRAGGELFF